MILRFRPAPARRNRTLLMRPKSTPPRSPLARTWRWLASMVAIAANGLHATGA
jgi:hypothetical protein